MVETEHEPTPTEPHRLSWDIVDAFLNWDVVWTMVFAMTTYCMTASTTTFRSGTGPGLLRAKLVRRPR